MTKTSAPPRPFETRRLATATGHVRVDEAGEGDLALLLSRDRQASALADRLAARFRTGLVDPADADEIGALDLADANLLAQGRDAAAALRAVAVRPGAIGSLVLLAPVFFDAKGAPVDAALAEAASGLDLPVMVALGTRDEVSPPDHVAFWRRLLPKAHVVFVYDAGADLTNERPDAVASLVEDFLARRDRFIVRAESGVLFP